MTKKELIESLEKFNDDQQIICIDGYGYWNYVDHIQELGSFISLEVGEEFRSRVKNGLIYEAG